jgi:energy-coupling factor transport system ATP-binding protein
MYMKSIKIENVSFQYGNSNKQLNNITTIIPQGSFCGVTGENGSGKTTFLMLLNGLIPHEIEGRLTGNVYVDDVNTKKKPVSYFAKSVGMVFQNPDFMIFNLTIRDEIAFGLKNLKFDRIDNRISEALSLVGLENMENQDPHTLSFGQKQKLCLATILAMDTQYIVLDEPSAMLDYKSTLNLYKLLMDLNKKGKTIIIVEHDTDYLLTYASQIIVFSKGLIGMQGKTKEIFDKKKELQKMGIKIPFKLNL